MKLEALSQFIVPLVFLAIWALTSLLNRDSQQLPQRPSRPGTGPRPGGQGGGRRDAFASARDDDSAPAVSGPPPRRTTVDSLDSRSMERDAAAQARPSTSRQGSGRALDADVYVIDDEVVFVDPVTRRPIASTSLAPAGGAARSTPRAPAPRKPARGRRNEPASARTRRADPETQRVLSEQVGLSLAQNRSQPLNLSPLTANLSNLSNTSLRDPSIASIVTVSGGPPALSAQDVRKMMADGARLREMAVLTELLQPPVSLRRPVRGR